VIIITAAAFLVLGTFLGNHIDEGGATTDVTATAIIFGVIAGVGIAILLVLLSIATIIAQLASVRGEKISFKEVVNQAQPFFWRFLGLGILSILTVVAGLILLIIPGIVLAFWLIFASYIMVDKNTGVIVAMKASIALTRKNWKVALALVAVQFIIQIPSALIPSLGSIATTALSIAYFCLPAILYLRITNDKKAATQTPKAAA